MPSHVRRSVVRALALSCVLSPVALAVSDSKPATDASKAAAVAKPSAASVAEARRLAIKALSTAIASLTKEYQAYALDVQKGGKTVKLREKADYFVENKTSDLTDASLLQAMNSTIINGEPAADAYIKWQLSSGLSDKIDSKLMEPLFNAYYNAPTIPHRPGMSAEEKKELDAYVKGAKGVGADVINGVNDKLKVPVDAWQIKIKPILAYRDAMHAHMPAGTVFEHLTRLEDIVKHIEAGISMEPETDKWRNNVKAWLKGNPAPAEAGFLAEAVLKVIDDMGGIVKKPGASAGGTGEVFASVVSPLLRDDTQAPVLLAANMKNSNNGNYPGGSGAAMQPKKEFPPKFYEQVEFDVKTNMLAWQNVGPRFIKKEILVELYQDLRDASKTAPANMTPSK